jgi:two-component system sensor histidine kinase FlrB
MSQATQRIASHEAPIHCDALLPTENAAAVHPAVLAGAFSQFMAVASTLEQSYRELQAQVEGLRYELAERNRALSASLGENARMRVALDEVMDAMPCGIVVLRADGLDANASIERLNPEALLLLGIDGTDAVRSLAGLAAGGGPDLRAFQQVEGCSEFAIAGSRAGRGAQGGKRWIEVQTRRMPITSAGVQTILILRDVSAQKQAAAEREQGRRAAALAEVAATMAHEMRNPLASLQLFVDLLEQEPGRMEQWVVHLRSGLQSMGASMNNVLAFYGGRDLHCSVLAIVAAVDRAVAFVQPMVTEAGIALRWSPMPWAAMAVVNEAALQQMVMNLVGNAVRHTPSGGTIAVNLGCRESMNGQLCARLEVADTGCGIAVNDLPHLFEAGWSARGTSSGLGLAVCQRIAAQLSGSLSVASVPGNGAVFCFEMPCYVPAAVAEAGCIVTSEAVAGHVVVGDAIAGREMTWAH